MLFTSLQLGDLEISNRVIMAPLTRCRASDGRVPNELMAEYYRQRSSAGLIITEATSISAMGVGYPNTPGIWSQEQTEGWKKITEAVHSAAGKIFLQLWHVGRISDPYYLDGKQPVAPSAVAAKGHVSLLRPIKEYTTPRALELNEITDIIEEYRTAADNAKEAGFDGVEIHSANGYLLDQFLQDSTNLRTDQYGGSIENRARLLLQVCDAVISVWSAGRVGVHLAPRGDAHDMGDSNPPALFSYVASELGKRKIAFICTREHLGSDSLNSTIKEHFGGCLIANEAFDLKSAEEIVSSGIADAVAFGKMFISNPDLPARFSNNSKLNEPNPETFYADGPAGYTDYPSI